MTKQVKIIIAEDKEMIRERFVSSVKEYGITTLAEASNGLELLELMKSYAPDVVLLDLRMPIMDGNIVFPKLRSLYPTLKIIILSSFNEKMLIDDFISRGAAGFVTKDEVSGDPEHLASIIRKVHYGAIHVTKNNDNSMLKLSEIQKDIIQMDGSGHEITEITDTTGLTRRAVNKQKQNLMKKLGVTTLAAYYARLAEGGFAFLRIPRKKGGTKN